MSDDLISDFKGGDLVQTTLFMTWAIELVKLGATSSLVEVLTGAKGHHCRKIRKGTGTPVPARAPTGPEYFVKSRKTRAEAALFIYIFKDTHGSLKLEPLSMHSAHNLVSAYGAYKHMASKEIRRVQAKGGGYRDKPIALTINECATLINMVESRQLLIETCKCGSLYIVEDFSHHSQCEYCKDYDQLDISDSFIETARLLDESSLYQALEDSHKVVAIDG